MHTDAFATAQKEAEGFGSEVNSLSSAYDTQKSAYAATKEKLDSLVKDRRDVGRFMELYNAILDCLPRDGENGPEEIALNEVLAMMACKAAVKAGDNLAPQEIQSLLAQRELVDRSSACPHGRPTTVRLTIRDMERHFKRT